MGPRVELLRRRVDGSSARPGARSSERGRRGGEREHSSGEAAEPRGARSPPQEHEGGPYSTERVSAAAGARASGGVGAKLQHFRDGSPCERPAGLLPSTARDGREDVIARAAAASCALGTSDRLALGGPVRGLRTACARRPDRREARAGTERARAAAATRCRRTAGEQPLPGGEPEAADCRAPASDQPPGARRRPRQSRLRPSARSRSGSSPSTRRGTSSPRSRSSSAPRASTT